MALKDYFSTQSKAYATFRPTYPEALFQFIFKHLASRNTAWDCATGNGQVAQYLSEHFKKVYATDISQQQLDNAFQADNISYSVSPAEHTSFADHQFDLITVGQALHWFDRNKFYTEVNRIGKPGSLLAVWGYAMLYVDPAIDKIILKFYNDIVGPYWDEARRLVEEEYKSVEFPFVEIPTPKFNIDVTWTLDHITGYFESWSATQKYIKTKGENPVPAIREELSAVWKEGETRQGRFPVFLKLGKVG